MVTLLTVQMYTINTQKHSSLVQKQKKFIAREMDIVPRTMSRTIKQDSRLSTVA